MRLILRSLNISTRTRWVKTFINVKITGKRIIRMRCGSLKTYHNFKYAKNRRKPVIITLELLPDSKTNENRVLLPDQNTNYTKNRASKIKVLKIEDTDGNTYENAYSDYDHSFKYQIGEIVKVDDFNDGNLQTECTTGIHYFKSYRGALAYSSLSADNITVYTGRNDDVSSIIYSDGVQVLKCFKSGQCSNTIYFKSDKAFGPLHGYYIPTDPDAEYEAEAKTTPDPLDQ